MVKTRNGLAGLEVLGETPLSTTNGTSKLLGKGLVLAELYEEGLVEEVLDVLVVVERGGGRRALVGALLVERLTGVDTCVSDTDQTTTWAPGEEHGLASIAYSPPYVRDLPLRIHRRRKSESEIWSFLSAWLRVM